MTAKVRRVIALLSLLSAVLSMLFAGTSYFFCPGMQRAAKSCCCPAERTSGSEPEISRAPCCDRTTLVAASTPVDASRPTVSVPSAIAFTRELVRVLDDARSARAEPRSLVREHGARAGPVRELFELHSVYLI